MEYYVYTFLDPQKPGKFHYQNLDMCFLFEPFYIGKGKRNRIIAHFCPSSLKENNFKSKKLKKMISEGIDPFKIKIYENLSEKESLFIENSLIFEIGRRDMGKGPLTNGSDGGEKNNNQNRKTKRIIQIVNGNEIEFISVKECAEYNKVYPERITEFLKCKRGKYFNLNIRYKDRKESSQNSKEYFLNKKDNRYCEINQYTLDGQFIKKWDSVVSASESLKISASSISSCCKKRFKKSGNFIWKYSDDKTEINFDINQYDLSGNLVKKWIDSSYLLSSNPFYKSTTINACLKGRIKSAYGFKWSKNKKK